MCKILDDVLPVVGAVVGSFILPGVGTAIGAGLGGFTGNYVQTHNFGSALGAGALSGATSAIGSGIGSAFNGLAGDAGSAFSSGAGEAGADTLGGLESASGGAAMFGPAAGTGTAIGSAGSALGGSGLGVAGGGALSGISDSPSYLGALGGGTQGTGLGLGTQGQSAADLSGVVNSANAGQGAGVSNAASPSAMNSPVSGMSGVQSGQGITGPTNTPNTPIGASLTDGSQAAAGSGGAPSTYMEGSQALPSGDQGALSSMYGANSTAPGSPMGAGIANTSVDVPGQGVQFGALGEGTSSAPGAAQAASDIPGQSIGSNYSMAANSAQQGGGGVNDFLNQLFGAGQAGSTTPGQLSPWLGLAQSGLGAYQQYSQQQANNRYRDQIDQEFSPNSPYAQQMSQTLGRQDAAAGRNSQYGTRAVQLAAALAQAHATALGNSNYAKAATSTPGANMLNTLLYTLTNPQYAQGYQQLGTAGFNGLQNLFGG
jgi:hypothetical protein